MSTPVLADLVVAVCEDAYGSVGARILRVLLERERCTAPEIARSTGLPPSTVLRTLVALVTNRFVLFWQQGSRTLYFANAEQVYTVLWSGQLLAMFPESASALLNLIVNGPSTPENAEDLRARQLVRPVADWEFYPPTELYESVVRKQQQAVSSDPSLMGLSETNKKQHIDAATNAELQRIRSSSRNQAPVAYVVNWNRFLVVARRLELVELAARKVGRISAKVYGAALELSESSTYRTRERRIPSPETTVTTFDIVNKLGASVNELSEAFPKLMKLGTPPDASEEATSAAKRTKSNTGAAITQTKRLKPAELVNKHLDLLAKSLRIRFLQRVGDRNGGEWFVPFDQCVSDMKRDIFDDIIGESFGEPSARLIRLIRDVGKLDEKMLANRALLPALEIRHHMSTLSIYGFADIQELAKPNERAAGPTAQKRSLFLWHHRPLWAYERLLDLLYAQMTEAMRDIKELRKEHAILLAKLSREDVQNDMEQFLTAAEKEELAQFNGKERELLRKVNRVDRHVRIFREY